MQSTATLYYLCTNILGRNAIAWDIFFKCWILLPSKCLTSQRWNFEALRWDLKGHQHQSNRPTKVHILRSHLKFMLLPVWKVQRLHLTDVRNVAVDPRAVQADEDPQGAGPPTRIFREKIEKHKVNWGMHRWKEEFLVLGGGDLRVNMGTKQGTFCILVMFSKTVSNIHIIRSYQGSLSHNTVDALEIIQGFSQLIHHWRLKVLKFKPLTPPLAFGFHSNMYNSRSKMTKMHKSQLKVVIRSDLHVQTRRRTSFVVFRHEKRLTWWHYLPSCALWFSVFWVYGHQNNPYLALIQHPMRLRRFKW